MKSTLKVLGILTLVVSLLITICIVKGNKILKQSLSSLKEGNYKMIYDADLGYRLNKNIQFTWDEYSFNPTDSNIVVTIDSLQRRVTAKNDSAVHHLITLGCSYTFGQGLNDEASIPYLISEQKNEFQVYNYAMAGYGAQHILPIFNKPIESEVQPDSGILLYFFIDHHLDRLVRDLFTIKFNYYTPYYKLGKQGEIINCGLYYQHKPLLTKFVLGLATYPRIFNGIRVIEPFFYKARSDKNYAFLAKIVAASEKAYLEKFPNSKYYVVIFPSENNRAKPFFEKEGLNVLDLSQQLNLDEINGRQKDGYHPNTVGAQSIAKLVGGIIDTL